MWSPAYGTPKFQAVVINIKEVHVMSCPMLAIRECLSERIPGTNNQYPGEKVSLPVLYFLQQTKHYQDVFSSIGGKKKL